MTVPATRAKPYAIDPELCMGCGACADVCFSGAIVARGSVFTVDAGRCDGCGLCARYCPLRAVLPAPAR